jgi:hypothetical protein
MATKSKKSENVHIDALENNNITNITQKTAFSSATTDLHGNSKNKPEEITKELLILEKRFSYRIPGQHYYDGTMWSSLVPVERLVELESFEVKHDDVIVTGYPKSGMHVTCNNIHVTISYKITILPLVYNVFAVSFMTVGTSKC